MKTTAILLIILAIGLIVTGCSKTVPLTTTPIVTDTANAADITIDETASNPDIGTLDDTPVSDELPQ